MAYLIRLAGICLGLILLGCRPSDDVLMDVEVIGHAGYGFTRIDQPYPANSLVAVSRAGMAGADAVEIDLMWSSDTVPYGLHDLELDEHTDLHGCISQLTSSELDAGKLESGGTEEFPLARIEDIIDQVKLWDMDLYLDMKTVDACRIFDDPQYPNIIRTMLADKEWTDRTTVIVTNPFWQYPLWQPTGLTIELDHPNSENWPDASVDSNFVGVMTSFSNATDELVEHAHQQGLRYVVYNLRSKSSLRKAALMGVDGVMVDNVPRAVEYFD